jgi:hypothetical protein
MDNQIKFVSLVMIHVVIILESIYKFISCVLVALEGCLQVHGLKPCSSLKLILV